MTARHSLAAVILLGGLIACGGGGSPTLPTNPSPPASNVNACGAVSQTISGLTAITNGTQCGSDNTSVVSLTMSDAHDRVGLCSGTVIAPRVVLTAAHCLDDQVTRVLVWRGEFPPQQIATTSFKGHPDYRSANVTAVDVGLVFVDQDLARPASPLLLSRDGQVGETAVVAGWGRDLQGVTGMLRAGTTTLTDVTSSVLRTPYSTMAAGICSGDSGGPILLSQGGAWSIAGIISATSANTCNTGEHFYAAVRNGDIQAFIRNNVQGFTER